MEHSIAIVVATYNAEKYLENALQSIIKQQYSKVEIIVIDGGSKDNTIAIIKEYAGYISYWVSEKDAGIYDAWNKGIRHAKSDWIMFLGSDDLLSEGALHGYNAFIASQPTDVELISSRVLYTDENMIPYRTMGWEWQWPRFQKEMTIAHPGALHSRKLFLKYGLYDTSYKIVGDYEFLLRARNGLKSAFFDQISVLFREGGASDGYAAINESFKASVHTGRLSPVRAVLYSSKVYLKYTLRKSLKRISINLYVRH